MQIKYGGGVGDIFEDGKLRHFVNRSGAATVKGGAYVWDIFHTEAESDSIDNGKKNVTAVSTALIATAPIIVIASDVIADNAAGLFYIGDGVECPILLEGTTDVTIASAVKIVNVQPYMVLATILTDRWHAKAYAAQTSATPTLTPCLLFSSGKW